MPDYRVQVEGSDAIPVRAATPAAARAHAVRNKVTVDKLTTEDAIAFGVAGVSLQIAGDDPEPEAADDGKGKTGGDAEE